MGDLDSPSSDRTSDRTVAVASRSVSAPAKTVATFVDIPEAPTVFCSLEVPRGWFTQLQFPHPGRHGWHSTRGRSLGNANHKAIDRMPEAGAKPRLDAHVLNGRVMI